MSWWPHRRSPRPSPIAPGSSPVRATVPTHAPGVKLTPLDRQIEEDRVAYSLVTVEIDRSNRTATIELRGPEGPPPADADEAVATGSNFWPLLLARELDDAILHLRVNELEIGTVVLRSRGVLDLVLEYDSFLAKFGDHWLVREVRLYWGRVLRRVDMTARTVIALVEPGSGFGGFLAELVLAADRSYMLLGSWAGEGSHEARLALTDANLHGYPMSNGLSRLETRFWGDDDGRTRAEAEVGRQLSGEEALAAGLVTDAMDEIDWDDELRIVLEERAAFSPDGLTGLEANLRFPGPESMETKIFGRLTAWQNWVFQRPNASGEDGALRRYGTGLRPDYDQRRV